MNIKQKINTYKWYILVTAIFAGGLYYYFAGLNATAVVTTPAFYVVNTVERGEVTSGIQTTGNIVAAQKLDIDVYKRLSRIDVVNIANGTHVKADDVLISFDKNDAYVDTRSSQVAVAEARLSLQTEQESVSDPSTQIRTTENQIAGYKKTISDTEQDIKDAYRDFLNEKLEVTAHPGETTRLADRTTPTLTGRYVSDIVGEYIIDIYASGAESGYSYRVNGLESITAPVISGKTNDLGTRGLKITFPNDIKSNDKWLVLVPNTGVATYVESKKDYDQKIKDLNKVISDAKVGLANSEQQLEDLKRTDSSNYRDLNVEKALTTLSAAQQKLSQNYDVVKERDIIAPFSGTVEGMENVVVGATPTGGTSDTINLGTLISDEFLTTFTLSASDVAKVSVGQKVKVTITSFTDQPVFEATITQISSLPESSGVAQYKVQALLDYDRATADLVLREGMLSDIEVVQKENSDAIRVPTSAIKYDQGIPKVTVVDNLTDEQKQQVSRMGIVRTDGLPLATYDVTVELGIVGQYYVEVTSGLDEGIVIVASALTDNTEDSAVQQASFGPGGGQRPAGDTQTNSRQTTGGK